MKHNSVLISGAFFTSHLALKVESGYIKILNNALRGKFLYSRTAISRIHGQELLVSCPRAFGGENTRVSLPRFSIQPAGVAIMSLSNWDGKRLDLEILLSLL